VSEPTRALHLVARPEGLPKESDFEIRESILPDPEKGQVLVHVRYISVDPAMRVWMSVQKSYWPPVELGDVMRAAAIGVVHKSAEPALPEGTWVSGMFGVRESLICDAKSLRPFDPAPLPDERWALSLFGGTGLTAYFGLIDIGRPQPGETLVVSSAAGAVGSAVVQIAKQLGCRVIGIAGGKEKCDYVVEELGADEAIDYKREKVDESLRLYCPQGVDVYFDNVGGEILDTVLRRLARRARIVLCGGISQYNATGEPRGPANYLNLISARARMEGFVVIDYLDRTDEAIAAMLPWVRSGKLRSRIDEAIGIAEFPLALRRVFTGANFGKQVVKI